MHRKTILPRFLAWSLALGFLINFSAQAVTAQGVDRKLPGFAQQPNIADGKGAPKDASEPYILVLSKDSTRQIEMSTKDLISEFRSENPTIVKVQALLDNARAVLVTGVNPGTTRIFLTDAKKNVESMEVRVLRGDEELVAEQAAARRRETDARIRADQEEKIVKTKHLMDLIRKTVPTANVEVDATKNIMQSGSSAYAGATGSVVTYTGKKWRVVLSGTVPLAESVPVITNLALGVFEDSEIINYMVIPGVQQVQIEVTIARVNRSRARNIGFSFLEAGKQHFLASTIGGGGSLTTGNVLPSVLSPISSLTATPNAVFGIFNDKQSFMGYLNALTTEGLAKLISEPRVMTLSGRAANIVSGGKTPILTSSGIGAPSVTYMDFGTVVDFLPIVLGNGKIHLEVSPQISSLDQAAGITIPGAIITSVPGFDVRSAKVTVEMQDGETLAIGGLIQNTVQAQNSKVPILGDIPFLAFAFTSKTYTESEEELIILVTPHLVNPMACNQLPKYLPGRETRTVDDFELFLEGILEAPRGQRNLTHPYTAAYLNGPGSGKYPCGDAAGGCGVGGCSIPGGCGATGCGTTGNCGSGVDSPYPTVKGNGSPLGGSPSAMPTSDAPISSMPQDEPMPNNNFRPLVNTPPVAPNPVDAPSAAPQTLPNLPPANTGAGPTTGATFGPAVTADPR
jgi:pilus assembly protein CpaC